MKSTQKAISKALFEVWKWKDEVCEDIKDNIFEGKQKYYLEELNKSVKRLNGNLIKNPDRSCSIIKFFS